MRTEDNTSLRPPHAAVLQQDTYVKDWTGSSPIARTHHMEPGLRVVISDVVPKRYVAYLRFEMAPLPEGLIPQVATLRLYRDGCEGPLGAQNAFHEIHIVNEAWSAEDLNDTYLPTYGPALDSQSPYSSAEPWIAWDVTHAVSQWYQGVDNYGLALDVVGPWTLHNFCTFSSAEGDHPPRLEFMFPDQHAGTLFLPYMHVPGARGTPTPSAN